MARRTNDGFTLVELMVVIVLIGLFAGIVGVNVMRPLIFGREKVAQGQIREFENAIAIMKIETGRYPGSLEELLESSDQHPYGYLKGKSIPLDPWGEEYLYDAGNGGRAPCLVLSKGDDRIEGTDDDVSSDNLTGPPDKAMQE